MKEEFQSKLLEILTSIQAAAGKASDFAVEQLPDIAQSYIAYGRISSLVWLFISVLAIVVCMSVGAKLTRKTDGLVWIPMGLISLVASIGTCVAVDQAMLSWFAPKVWLIKEIASIIK